MDPTAIISKTAKGIAELGSRGLGLTRDHYRLLGQVDGKATTARVAESAGLSMAEAEPMIARLQADGLIQLLTGAADRDLAFYPNGAAISVTELDPEEGVRAWAEAQRGVQELRGNGFYAGTVRPMQGGNKPNILSVEDDPLVARLLGVLLSREGYAVRHAADGKAAFRELEENPPDLAILDIMLPDTTGFEILEWIRHRPNLAALPVIMVTAQMGEEDVLRGLRAGADGYIFKPFRPEPLLKCIRSVLKI